MSARSDHSHLPASRSLPVCRRAAGNQIDRPELGDPGRYKSTDLYQSRSLIMLEEQAHVLITGSRLLLFSHFLFYPPGKNPRVRGKSLQPPLPVSPPKLSPCISALEPLIATDVLLGRVQCEEANLNSVGFLELQSSIVLEPVFCGS